MMMNNEAHQKVTTAHLSRLAYLYVRQSTLRQVFENTESTRQYALRERAVALGWPLDRIVVIDNGTVSEIGAHEDLMKRFGTYRRLYELQFADTEVPKAVVES